MVGDRVEPGRKLRAGDVTFARPIDAQKYLLRQILGQVAASHQVLQNRDQAILIAQHQLVERGGVVVAHRQHQPDIRIL